MAKKNRDPLKDLEKRRAEKQQGEPEQENAPVENDTAQQRDPIKDLERRMALKKQESGQVLTEQAEDENAQTEGPITREVVAQAVETLKKYKDGKKNLEQRIIQNEQWWKLRHWEYIRNEQANQNAKEPEPTSAWLFNSLANKHADAMDNYPSVSVLPREKGDKDAAQHLSQILPVVVEQNGYKKTYSSKWWYKLKQGTSCEGVFWNPRKYNGLGDIEIKRVDLLNIFWEPGIDDIQNSRNFFHLSLRDNDLLEQQYPQLKDKLGGETLEIGEYIYDDTVDTTGKSVVVDWYYKKLLGNKTILHYCQFCNGEVLFASENEPDYAQRGFYDHGKYPFVFDTLFPEEGSPAGFGYIDVMKDPQLQIDKLDQAFLQNAVASSRKRFFVNQTTGKLNEDEMLDVSKPFVHVDGRLGDDSIKEITLSPLNDVYVALRNNKVEELKETSGNRDFSQGSTASGVTAASAIAALQEAGSKLSRDMIQTSYDCFEEINSLCIELIRQFYDTPRSFRIIGEEGQQDFVQYTNGDIKPTAQGTDFAVEMGERMPIFDIKVRAQKNNPFSRLSHNELALQFYSSGFFNPQMCDQAVACLDMMDFEGKDDVLSKVKSNGTMFQQLQMLQQQAMQLAQIVDTQNGTNIMQQMAQQFSTGQMMPSLAVGAGELNNNSLGAEKSVGHATAEQARNRAATASEPR